MKGFEHYTEAERLLDILNGVNMPPDVNERGALIGAASVHATLALASATALNGPDAQLGENWAEWKQAAG